MNTPKDTMGQESLNNDDGKRTIKGRTDIAQGGTSAGMGGVGQQSDDPEIEDADGEPGTSTRANERDDTTRKRGGTDTDGGRRS